jgi:hypothetical protein
MTDIDEQEEVFADKEERELLEKLVPMTTPTSPPQWAVEAWDAACDAADNLVGELTNSKAAATELTRLCVSREEFDNPGDDLTFILGRPSFMFIREASLWRETGTLIPRQAEAEQAFFIGRLLHHYFANPEMWREAFGDEVQARRAKARQALEASNAK